MIDLSRELDSLNYIRHLITEEIERRSLNRELRRSLRGGWFQIPSPRHRFPQIVEASDEELEKFLGEVEGFITRPFHVESTKEAKG